MRELSFQMLPFQSLTLEQFHDIAVLRNLVFVVGQKITAEPEIDGDDPAFHHVLVRDEAGALVGTARVSMDASPIMVGRVAVHPGLQRGGVGTWMMERVQDQLGARSASLHAQAHLEDWYTRLGWRRHGDVFVEAEIPHVHMFWGDSA